MPFLFLFALFMLVDFASLFMLGHWIGGLYALLIMIVSALLGIQLIRREGLATLRQAQARFLGGEDSSDEVMRGVALIFAGILMMLPGTLTDLLGLCCLLPVSSRFLAGKLLGRTARSRVFRGVFSGARPGGPFQDVGRGPGQRHQPSSDDSSTHDSTHQKTRGPLEGDYIEGDHIESDRERHR